MTEFKITNVNGVADFDVTIPGPGVFVARGRNGAGKTSVLQAVARAAGDATATVEPTDGLAAGTVTGPGVVVRVGSRTTTDGLADVRLMGAGMIAELIDPSVKTDAARAKARLRALVSMIDFEVTQETLVELASGDADLVDGLHYVGGLLGAQTAVWNTAHDKARALEAEASKTEGEAGVLRAQLAELSDEPPETPPLPLEQAEAVRDQAVAALAQARVEWAGRQEMEKRQAAIRESLGEKPDLDAALAEYRRLEEVRDAAVAAEETAREAWVTAKNEVALSDQDLAGARKRGAQVRTDLEDWGERQKILDEPLTGATEGDVERLAAAESDAVKGVMAANEARLRATYQDGLADAAERLARATDRAAALRVIAKATPDTLATILSTVGVAGVTVHEGRLCAVQDGAAVDWESRLSFGQQVRLALQVALRGHQAEGVVLLPLAPEFWAALDPERKAEVASIATEAGVALLTEEPTDGELRVEPAT